MIIMYKLVHGTPFLLIIIGITLVCSPLVSAARERLLFTCLYSIFTVNSITGVVNTLRI